MWKGLWLGSCYEVIILPVLFRAYLATLVWERSPQLQAAWHEHEQKCQTFRVELAPPHTITHQVLTAIPQLIQNLISNSNVSKSQADRYSI